MKTTANTPEKTKKIKTMHMAAFTAVILIHIVGPVYRNHFGHGLTPFNNGPYFLALHGFVFVVIPLHVWRMAKRKNTRSTEPCVEA